MLQERYTNAKLLPYLLGCRTLKDLKIRSDDRAHLCRPLCAVHSAFIPEGEKFCPGKLTLGKILPGKNSVPELKNGGKKSVPSGFGKVKRTFGAKRRRKFWPISLVDDSMKLSFP
jgi:hypothetical protein